MARPLLMQLTLFFWLGLFTGVVAQGRDLFPVSIGTVEVNEECNALTIDGTALLVLPFVRVQMSLVENPRVLLIDEIVPVDEGRFYRENIEFPQLHTAAMNVMVTGWAGNNYVTALTPEGMHPLWCSDENYPEDQFRAPGLRFMSSTRQQWNNTSRLSTDSNCDAVPENGDVSFPSTLLEGEAEITAFPVTLKMAENGFLLRLDWEGRRFNVVEDEGVWNLVYEDSRNHIHYEAFLYFTTLISYTGGMIVEHPNGCYWSFDWHGSRITW